MIILDLIFAYIVFVLILEFLPVIVVVAMFLGIAIISLFMIGLAIYFWKISLVILLVFMISKIKPKVY